MTRARSLLVCWVHWCARTFLPVLLLALAAGSSAADAVAQPDELRRAREPAGVRVPFSTDDALRRDRFALFIGIDRYPKVANGDLDGCVYDAWTLKSIFVKRFGIERWSMLTNAQANRAGIAAQFQALVNEVEQARKRTQEPVSVVIVYAGHGSQVLDKNGDETGDGLDETWVATDSDLATGANDILDDELQAVYRRLVDLGCQTVIISDSCHSGTMHRGSDKMRRLRRAAPVAGPDDDLFASFQDKARGRDADETKPLPGLAFYGACHEALQAYEYREPPEEGGRPCGRFTYALRQVLPSVGPQTTFRDLYEQIALAFEKTWPGDRRQRPYFHADPRKIGEVFLTGGRPEPYANILPLSQHGRRLELDMGELDGVVTDAAFTLYASVQDLHERCKPLGAGRVVSATPFTCTVELPEGLEVPTHSKGRLNRIRLRDLRILADDGLPKPVRAVLDGLDSAQQLRFVPRRSEGYDLALLAVPGRSGVFGLYSASDEPDPDPQAARQPMPLREFTSEAPAAADRLAEELLVLARAQRLMSLDHGTAPLSVHVVPLERDSTGRLLSLQRPSVGGVLRLKDGDLFTVRVQNPGPAPLHVTLFYLDPSLRLQIIYPQVESDENTVPANGTLEIARQNPFNANAEHRAEIEANGFERIRVKVIASSVRLDLTPLVVPPRLGVRGERKRGTAPDVPLFNLLGDVLLGGPAARGPNRTAMPTTWAAATLLVDVEPRSVALAE